MIVYSTLYKDEQAKASEKSRKTLYPVELREAAGHDHNTKLVFLHVKPYRASYANFVTREYTSDRHVYQFPGSGAFLAVQQRSEEVEIEGIW